MTAPPQVVVAGGGMAGLSAALRAARAGMRVTLLERRPFLGGRAYSFTHGPTGDVLDNGPHAFMGAYTKFLEFCRDIGVSDAIAFQPRLHVPMAHAVDGTSAIAAPVFDALGADCVVIHASPNGTNINAGCGSTHPELLRAGLQ